MAKPKREILRVTQATNLVRCFVPLLRLFTAAALGLVWIEIGFAQRATGDVAPPLTAPLTISGQVVNASTGLPVARALVRLNDRAMLTTHDGKFQFDQFMESDINLQVSKPGFYPSNEPGGSSGIHLPAARATTTLELRLYPEAIFTGTVTAPDGDPIPQILVSARRSMFNGSGHTWIPVAQGLTDSHGRFRLPVPAGDYKLISNYVPRMDGTDQAVLPVVVPAEDSTGTSSFIHIRSGEEQHFDLHSAIRRAYTVSATFDSDLGRGFPRITARSSNGSILSLPVHRHRNEDDSVAQMELPSDTYTLDADIFSVNGTEAGETTVTVTDHDVSGVVFHLTAVPSLPVELQTDGPATSDNAQPNLSQFGLMLQSDQVDLDNLNFPVPLMMRKGGGMMSFTASPGSYRLRARNNGGQWYIKAANYGATDLLQQPMVVVPGAGGIPIRITVSNQTASLQGTCKLGGVAEGCWVYLIPTTPSAATLFTMHGNTQGLYNFDRLPPGSYQAVAFEQMHSVDYGDPAVLAPFAAHVRAITINAGEKPTLDLDAVPEAEMAP